MIIDSDAEELGRKLPFPTECITTLHKAFKEGRLNSEEVQEINKIICSYLDIREVLLYGDKLE